MSGNTQSGTQSGAQSDWGRVGDDGTVYVRTSEGEREVGQYPQGSADEALQFFTKRYDELAFEVGLLEQRISSGVLAPDDAVKSVDTVRTQVVDAHAVGDLAALIERLDGLGRVIESQREQRRAERAERIAASQRDKERIVAEAESISEGQDWRNGANRLRDLLEEWKSLPRLDRKSDDALWRRFSSARTSYTRRRKAHFAQMNQRRDEAKVVKERLVKEAEALADSTDWGPTSGKYRDLMREWKAAGPAPRGVEDKLWKRFRGAQDTFFGARDEANARLDEEYAANAEVKEGLLAEAEALLPVTDVEDAKRAFRDISARWDEAGKVPRKRIKEFEGRIRKVETAIRNAEDEQWRANDPEKSARADDMISKLERTVSETEERLEKARAAGRDKQVRELEQTLESNRSFLDMARRTAQDFSA